MGKYSEYIFSLGDSPKRHYKGKRLRPVEAFKLGMKVSKELCSVLSASGSSIDELGTEEKGKEENNSPSAMSTIVKAIAQINPDIYIGFVDSILKSTIIEASADGGENRNLVSEKAINEWFELYPEDYLMFTAQVLWQNVSPFLPKAFLRE